MQRTRWVRPGVFRCFTVILIGLISGLSGSDDKSDVKMTNSPIFYMEWNDLMHFRPKMDAETSKSLQSSTNRLPLMFNLNWKRKKIVDDKIIQLDNVFFSNGKPEVLYIDYLKPIKQ
uniref:Uncharacterized protein n=1 Tax=Strigamia maritima TaxID=126957 RepID=T1J927_STRMM